MAQIPTFEKFIGLSEGILTNYRMEREGMKLTEKQLVGSFDEVIKKLIEEKIPFYFDCSYKEFTKIGYLMNEVINNVNFNGYILDNEKTADALSKEFTEKILKDVMIEKPGKLHVGRTNFADLTKAADLDEITTVVKAFKTYSKDKGLSSREITGNKYEVNISIDFLCDKTRTNDIIDYVF